VFLYHAVRHCETWYLAESLRHRYSALAYEQDFSPVTDFLLACTAVDNCSGSTADEFRRCCCPDRRFHSRYVASTRRASHLDDSASRRIILGRAKTTIHVFRARFRDEWTRRRLVAATLTLHATAVPPKTTLLSNPGTM
jgi:wobble nucleotide-excising tRNase